MYKNNHFHYYLRGIMNRNGMAEKLLQTGAVKLSPNQPYTWASGWKSPIYCDNRKLLSFPYTRDFVKSELSNLIYTQYADAELIAGVATAGIAWGALVADQLKLPFIYVRPKPKEHGMGNQIEGGYVAGQKTVVVEDLISTGKSSLQVVEVLRSAGLDIMGMAALFTYKLEEAENNFANANVKYDALTDYGTLISIGLEKGIIATGDEALLQQWRQNPSGWQK